MSLPDFDSLMANITELTGRESLRGVTFHCSNSWPVPTSHRFNKRPGLPVNNCLASFEKRTALKTLEREAYEGD